VIPNVEYYQYTPSGVRVGRSGFPAPDVPAYASRDYGNRVGFWRMLGRRRNEPVSDGPRPIHVVADRRARAVDVAQRRQDRGGVRDLDHVLTHMKKHDEVWTTTGGEIAAWYRRLSHDH
jgi:hypothetical protein